MGKSTLKYSQQKLRNLNEAMVNSSNWEAVANKWGISFQFTGKQITYRGEPALIVCHEQTPKGSRFRMYLDTKATPEQLEYLDNALAEAVNGAKITECPFIGGWLASVNESADIYHEQLT